MCHSCYPDRWFRSCVLGMRVVCSRGHELCEARRLPFLGRQDDTPYCCYCVVASLRDRGSGKERLPACTTKNHMCQSKRLLQRKNVARECSGRPSNTTCAHNEHVQKNFMVRSI